MLNPELIESAGVKLVLWSQSEHLSIAICTPHISIYYFMKTVFIVGILFDQIIIEGEDSG